MSADNGVYILVSRGRKTQHGRRKTEYRVAYAQAIENISYWPDFPDCMVQYSELNRESVLAIFGESAVFTDRKVAEGYGRGVHDMWMKSFGYMEYGVVLIERYAHIPFPKPVESLAKASSLN